MTYRMSKGLIELLLFLLDTRSPSLGLSEEAQDRIRGILTEDGTPKTGEAWHKAGRALWALVIDAEQHILHIGELHVEDGARILKEVRRLLIDRGYYRKRLLLDTEPADFELNGHQWLWAGKTKREG